MLYGINSDYFLINLIRRLDMELGHVSSATFAGLVFTLIVSFGVPIILLLVAKIKYKANIVSFFIGAGTFTLFALILEQILHSMVMGAVGVDNLTSNIWLYAIYGAGAAAVFEETGRFIALKFWNKKRLNRENAFMYGIGHGGIEAIIIVGITSISNIAVALAINSGAINATLGLLDEEMRTVTYEQISQLWTLEPYQFYMGGIERIIAIALHIGMTFVMYRGVKYGDRKNIAMAFVIHFLADFVTVIVNNYAPVWVVEAALAVFVVGIIGYAYNINKEE